MVDFKNALKAKKRKKVVDPVELYGTLDRHSDKGPLRPAQEAVLRDWHTSKRKDRDVIIKLHTGQGKTLIGLLMLQSRLHELAEPVVYLCPNNYLVEQTCEQAKQFGIRTCKASPHLPEEFLSGTTILVATVQKLFNGMTMFKLNESSIVLDSVLMDDAHACSEQIRDACRIRLSKGSEPYERILEIFRSDLERQGAGTLADIENGSRDDFVLVPYWAWSTHNAAIAKILSNNSSDDGLKFQWPLLKDRLRECKCVVSGTAIEIEAVNTPISSFGSYSKANQRIFMSATTASDAFLVKGLGVAKEAIIVPITDVSETWSGEKMILIPSLINPLLNRDSMINSLCKKRDKRTYGVVALTPSFYKSKEWGDQGAECIDKNSIGEAIDRLESGNFQKAIVFANRYEGIDLPDRMCRMLIIDSLPFSESLLDSYEERCRSRSEFTLMRTLRSVEQGIGRSVRGEKDFSIVVIVGAELIRLIQSSKTKSLVSPQTRRQIEIGFDIVEMAKQDGGVDSTAEESFASFTALGNQCLQRDEDWKEYYQEQMSDVVPEQVSNKNLSYFKSEYDAEACFTHQDPQAAAEGIQALL